MRRTSIAFILAILSSGALADDLVGRASVIDGDTLDMHGVRIRLWGIDAPETTQLCRGEDSLQYRCGAQAANDLDAFIAQRPVNCVLVSLDRYGRTVAACSVAGRDLAEWLVRSGLALDWRQYSKANITRLSGPVRDFGKAATSSRGSIAHAFARAASRLPVPTTRMPILDGIHPREWQSTTYDGRLPQFCGRY